MGLNFQGEVIKVDLAWQKAFWQKNLEKASERDKAKSAKKRKTRAISKKGAETAKKEEGAEVIKRKRKKKKSNLELSESTLPSMDIKDHGFSHEVDWYNWDIDPPISRKPVIYYGTRTHKQIQQVVEELQGKTPYTPRMTILGGRQQYCIHPKASKEINCDEACRKLCDQNSLKGVKKMTVVVKDLRNSLAPLEPEVSEVCPYFSGALTMFHKMNDPKFLSEIRRESGMEGDVDSPVWSGEDLILAGETEIGCPYYAARELAKEADIVFCPYNYLLHPSIREAMGIDLEGNIVIIDEAHNIEDTARDAASFDLPLKLLEKVGHELKALAKDGDPEYHITPILSFVGALQRFSEDKLGFFRAQEDRDQGKMQYVWKVDQFWKNLGFGTDLSQIEDDLETLMGYKNFCRSGTKREYKNEDKGKSENEDKCHARELSDQVERALDSLLAMLDFMVNFKDSYIVAVETLGKSITLSFWCLDSGIIFSSFSKKARSVILTSGTLAPLDTFSTELSTRFGLLHEGHHVINQDQVWAGAVSVGPKGTVLNGVYLTAQTQAYQDELGAALIAIARTVPGGILCFLPSYTLLNTLMARWKSTGDFIHLERIKQIFIEPKHTSEAFDGTLKAYRYLCKDPGSSGITGPIMFAVFRGKLSEGISFRDAECRCVVSIGIPYPSSKDLKVILKRDFNDHNQDNRQMASGSAWYNTQAYRAINQAIGRCIRHRNDWGAIVFLENRFARPQHNQNISKWARSSLIRPCSFKKTIASLSSFVARHDPSFLLQKYNPSLHHSGPALFGNFHQDGSTLIITAPDDCIKTELLPQESSLAQPGTLAVCDQCKHKFFLASLTPPPELSNLSFPAQHLRQYSIFKTSHRSTMSLVPTTAHHGMPTNTFYDQADGILYGYFGCPSCASKSSSAFPLAIRILFTSPNAAAKLPHNHLEWIWAHPSFCLQPTFYDY